MSKLINNELPKIYAVDFDGVLCEEKWPAIGKPNEEVIAFIKSEQEKGAKIILWTNRCGERLDEAIKWSGEHGIIFDAINDNLPEAIELYGGNPRKIFAHEYIDDRNSTRFELPFTTEDTYKLEIISEVTRTYEASGVDAEKIKNELTDRVVTDIKESCKNGGQAHINLVLTKNGKYVDSDEDYIDVNADNKKCK